MALRLLLSCEHGGNQVPVDYRGLFRGRRAVLNSHRGLDLGALTVARYLQRQLGVPLIAAMTTRLLVDLNRSIGHPRLFSNLTRPLPDRERRRILDHYYYPYRTRVADQIAGWIGGGHTVLHLSVHSFTPVLDGELRRADIGLLYDPARRREREFCHDWQARLAAASPDLAIRRNYPYRGTSDGLQVKLRRRFPATFYIGIELELDQSRVAGRQPDRRLPRMLLQTLQAAVNALRSGVGRQL